jgi:hypothetical protein
MSCQINNVIPGYRNYTVVIDRCAALPHAACKFPQWWPRGSVTARQSERERQCLVTHKSRLVWEKVKIDRR